MRFRTLFIPALFLFLAAQIQMAPPVRLVALHGLTQPFLSKLWSTIPKSAKVTTSEGEPKVWQTVYLRKIGAFEKCVQIFSREVMTASA